MLGRLCLSWWLRAVARPVVVTKHSLKSLLARGLVYCTFSRRKGLTTTHCLNCRPIPKSHVKYLPPGIRYYPTPCLRFPFSHPSSLQVCQAVRGLAVCAKEHRMASEHVAQASHPSVEAWPYRNCMRLLLCSSGPGSKPDEPPIIITWLAREAPLPHRLGMKPTVIQNIGLFWSARPLVPHAWCGGPGQNAF